MNPQKPTGISRRTAISAAAWSVPVIAAAITTPLASASVTPELTVSVVMDCNAVPRLVIYVTNNTDAPVVVMVDLDRDLDGVPESGEGPSVAAGDTHAFTYGLVQNGTLDFHISTVNGFSQIERVVVACA